MKKLPLLLIFLFLPIFCFGQLKASAKTGIIGTDTKEILWNKSGDNAQISSLLEWQTYVAPVIKVDEQYKFAQKYLIGAGGFYTIPFSYGIMEDYDYLNLFSTGTNERTHYSKHDNKIQNYWSADIFFGAGGSITRKLDFTALFSIEYSYYSFSAFDGFGQYGTKTGEQNGEDIFTPWNKYLPKKIMTGKIINYEVRNLYFGLGTRIDYSATDKILLSFIANLKPSLFNYTFDTHYKRTHKYNYLKLSGELAFDTSLLLEYRINKSNAFNCELNFAAAFANNGKLITSKDKQNWEEAVNSCGNKNITWKLLVGYTYIYEK